MTMNNTASQQTLPQDMQLLDHFVHEHTRLFLDQQGEAHVEYRIQDDNPLTAISSLKDKRLVSHLRLLWMEHERTILKPEAINNVLAQLEAMASIEERHELNPRVAWHVDGQAVVYDLGSDDGAMIYIDDQGCKTVYRGTAHLPPLHRPESHHEEQVTPSSNISPLEIQRLFSNFLKISPEDQPLIVAWLGCSLLAQIHQPALYLTGGAGAAKSTSVRMLRRLVDPSKTELLGLARRLEDTEIQLANNHIVAYDNVGDNLKYDVSDLFCTAITGGMATKREHYSNGTEYLMKFDNKIIFNGVNLAATRPDLLDRMIIIDCERLSPSERRDEQSLYAEFNQYLPDMFGALCAGVVEALKIQPSLDIKELQRFADFTIWGEAFSRAFGYEPNSFLDAYAKNTSRQITAVIDSDVVATVLKSYCEANRSSEIIFEGTAQHLLNELLAHIIRTKIIPIKMDDSPVDPRWPKSESAFGKKMQHLPHVFEQLGIFITQRRESSSRFYEIGWLGGVEQLPSLPSLPSYDDRNDTSDSIGFTVEDTTAHFQKELF